ASPDASSPQRYLTTVPQQALFLLNSPFVQVQVKAMLKRHEIAAATDTADKIRKLHRLTYGRDPDAEEVRIGQRFVSSAGTGDATTGMTSWERYGQVLLLANEFMFVD